MDRKKADRIWDWLCFSYSLEDVSRVERVDTHASVLMILYEPEHGRVYLTRVFESEWDGAVANGWDPSDDSDTGNPEEATVDLDVAAAARLLPMLMDLLGEMRTIAAASQHRDETRA